MLARNHGYEVIEYWIKTGTPELKIAELYLGQVEKLTANCFVKKFNNFVDPAKKKCVADEVRKVLPHIILKYIFTVADF